LLFSIIFFPAIFKDISRHFGGKLKKIKLKNRMRRDKRGNWIGKAQ
jgi:hypothetical protein